MKVVKRWQELEGQVQRPSVFDGSKMGNTLAAMEAFTRMTQTSESGKLLLFQNLQKSADLYDFLPSYAIDTPVVEGAKPVSSEVTYSATALPKRFKVKLSTQAFNKKMLEVGLLTEKERSGTKGAIKKFKVLTDLAYGKNVVSPQNPRETAPHYYEKSFTELLSFLGVDFNDPSGII